MESMIGSAVAVLHRKRYRLLRQSAMRDGHRDWHSRGGGLPIADRKPAKQSRNPMMIKFI
jgi:hypothetical protein